MLIKLYHLFFKPFNTFDYIENFYSDDYFFEQSNDNELNNLLTYDYFNDYLCIKENQYYHNHFDYNFLNKIDEYLTKYF